MQPNDISLERDIGERDWLKRNRNKKLDSLIMEYSKTTWSALPHEIDMKIHKNYIDENIFSLVRQNPTTKFYFFIPTHTRLIYRIKEEAFDFYKWRSVMSYLLKKA